MTVIYLLFIILGDSLRSLSTLAAQKKQYRVIQGITRPKWQGDTRFIHLYLIGTNFLPSAGGRRAGGRLLGLLSRLNHLVVFVTRIGRLRDNLGGESSIDITKKRQKRTMIMAVSSDTGGEGEGKSDGKGEGKGGGEKGKGDDERKCKG